MHSRPPYSIIELRNILLRILGVKWPIILVCLALFQFFSAPNSPLVDFIPSP
jgi:hypothetical protein